MAADPARRPKANPKAAIQDWLTLVDPDGAFLTPSELNAVFPHGFEQMDRDLRTELRARVADLAEADDSTTRTDLRRWILGTALDWDDLLADGQRIPAPAMVRAAEHGVPLRPTHVLLDADDANSVRLGVFTWPLGTPLDRRTDVTASGDTWVASPVQRAETWCRESGTPLALVTDDDTWTLVWAPRGAPAASGTWTISDLADETILQSGLVSLLGARRFFAVSDEPKTGETLERLFERAADAEADLTKGLGASVRQSVELLVAAISRDHVASSGKVLADVAGTEVYESAVAVLMRLVFLLFAEERRLLPAEDPLWAESYSVLTLRDDLRQAATRDGLDALERRSTAWHRLLATFRAVHGGVNHDRLTLLAYGGSLFDPDRFPFLEGRRNPHHLIAGGVDLGPVANAAEGPGRPVAVDDRTVLAILDSLLTVQVKSGHTKVAQRVSYKALDVEQIGHCYEGLLDHGAVPIDDLALGLVGPDGGEPEFTVAELEAFDDSDRLCEWLSDKTRCNKKASALAKLIDRAPEGVDLARLRVACGHDDDTVERVLPYWGLIRPDLRGLPVVLLPGSMFVTQTSTRRNTGAQYTTKALAEEVVQYALEPLVYDPGPQNEPDQADWKLKTPAAILDLRICDPAVGSGAILTAAGRYLADRLVESVIGHGAGEGAFAARFQDLAAAPAEEQTVLARREIVDHCLYGVDKNPVAAEMAKLSLWLTTVARERPFTFLDHAIQVGDSLLGITDIDQLRWLHLDPSQRQGQRGFESIALEMRLKEAVDLARRLRDLSVVAVRDAVEKQRLHEEFRLKLAGLSVVADAVVGAALNTAGKGGAVSGERTDSQMERIRAILDDVRSDREREAALSTLGATSTAWLRTDLPDEAPVPWERQCLHWPLAFPDVFLDGQRAGFDAVIGNPPFLGGKRITGAHGVAYREHVVRAVADGAKGNADLVAYFVLRSCSISQTVGLLATNTLSQGDTREVGLDRLLSAGWVAFRAVKTEPWPNEAGVEIAKVWLIGSPWRGSVILDGSQVKGISSSLDVVRRVEGTPRVLAECSGKSFIGSVVNGAGFMLKPEEAAELLERDPRNADVLRPYQNGADLNEEPRQRPRRWVINFFDWPIERAKLYPDCFEIVEHSVKPARSTSNRPRYRDVWWQFSESCFNLYHSTSHFERVISITRVSRTIAPAFVKTGSVASDATVIFAYDDDAHFGLLSSAPHFWWAVTWCSTMRSAGLRYSPTDAFETFPQPHQTGESWDRLDSEGRRMNEFRSDLMIRTDCGLTKTYNRVHDPDEHDPDTQTLRQLHVHLDCAVRDAYGWADLELDHHHWETPQGMRFTVGPEAKDEILDRLLDLNHERYAEEVVAGLHDKKAKTTITKRATKKTSKNQGRLM
jgi:hypothetical protein